MRIKVVQLMEKDGTKNPWCKAVILNGDVKSDKVYELTEIDEQTDLQRKLFHPLVKLYYESNCHNRKVSNWHELREDIKLRLGAGYETIRFTTSDYAILEIPYKDKENIPKDVIEDYKKGNHARVQLILKSMSDYTKKEYREITGSLINEMLQNGVLGTSQEKKFNEILDEIGYME
jgi:hypothetical protein